MMMQMLGYVLAFVIAVGIIITVHEFGHYWVARRLGVKVLRFSVGLGKPVLPGRLVKPSTSLRGFRWVVT